ncbi:hypothetical protein DRE_02583 [Drechslerella stenobrocha 248]|uniref:Nephrocystin 3-like N-terminal domain-containing protein n=1 Tax=Drechslerella stenobrocha 248 TaxID=1043628 RepID=W7HWT9_9PEZI|nr:hypothetical protein DRE_02583 [Drechslerella stenobrocha 248]
MDPISAVGIASATITFLTAAIQISRVTNEIYKSTDGMTKETKIMSDFATDARLDSEAARLPILQNHKRSDQEERIYKEAKRCKEIAVQFYRRLQDRQPKDSKSLKDTLITAYKTFIGKKHDTKIVEQLQGSRQLLFNLRASLTLATISRIVLEVEKNLGENLGLLATQDGLVECILTIKGAIKDANRDSKTELASLSKQLAELEKTLKDWPFDLAAIREAVPDTTQLQEDAIKNMQVAFLKELKLGAAHFQFNAITYDAKLLLWLLDDNQGIDGGENGANTNAQRQACEKLEKWMTSEHGIFYISGKPGAGKSTLIKFLYTQGKTIQRLQTWALAGNKKLCYGHFFFFQPDGELAHSLCAFKSAILHTVLSSCPSMISTLFSGKWERFQDSPGYHIPAFRKDEVNDAFDLLIKEQLNGTLRQNYRFAFFIDGVDEFVSAMNESPLDVSRCLVEWASAWGDSLKICVSSRDDRAFVEPLNQDPKFRVEDLTGGVMLQTARKRLTSIGRFHKLFPECQQQNQVLEHLVERSEGIFLWLQLVLSGLEDSLCKGVTKKLFLSRIDGYPARLTDKFFLAILSRDLGDDSDAVLKSLKFVVEATKKNYQINGLAALAFELCGEMEEGSETRLHGVLARRLEKNKLSIKHKDISKNCLCGPTEIAKLIHRSIDDFLKTDVASKLGRLWNEFCWQRPLCYGMLFDWRVLPDDPSFQVINRVISVMISTIGDTDRVPDWFLNFLQEVDEIQNAHCTSEMKKKGISRCPDLSGPEPKWGTDLCRDGLHLAIDLIAAQNGLYEYLEKLYEDNPAILNDTPLLAATAKCILGLTVGQRPRNCYMVPTMYGVAQSLLPRRLKALEAVLKQGRI